MEARELTLLGVNGVLFIRASELTSPQLLRSSPQTFGTCIHQRKKVLVMPADRPHYTHFNLNYLHSQNSDELQVNSREYKNSESTKLATKIVGRNHHRSLNSYHDALYLYPGYTPPPCSPGRVERTQANPGSRTPYSRTLSK